MYAFNNFVFWIFLLCDRIAMGIDIEVACEAPITQKETIVDERFVWNEYIIRSLLDFRERLEAQKT
jgi:hypothetical protein